MESKSTDSSVSDSNLTKADNDEKGFGSVSLSSGENESETDSLKTTSKVDTFPLDLSENVPCDPATKIEHQLISGKPDNDKELGATGGITTEGTSSESEDSDSSTDEEIPESLENGGDPKAVQSPQDKSNEDELKVKQVKLFDCDPDIFCRLCGEPYRDPRILSCLHSFCCQCLMKLRVVKSKEPGVGHVVCPFCKAKSKVNTEAECSFSMNPFLSNHVKIGQAVKCEAQCEMCKIRGENNPASGFCVDCEDMLCKDCCEKHTYSRVTVNHKIVSIEELSKGEYNTNLVNRQVVMCPAHVHEELKFYCSDCDVGVCRDCILLHHQNHTCKTSQETAEKLQSELKNLMFGVRQKQKTLLDEDINKFSLHMEHLEELQEAEIEQVTTVTNKLIDLLNVEKENYHKQIKKQFTDFRNKYKMRRGNVENVVKKMEETCDFTEKLLRDGKPEEIISLANVIRHRAVYSLNADIQPEPVSWYSPPYVQVNMEYPKKLSEVKFPYFKVMPAKKWYDPIMDMKVETTFKEMLEMKGLNAKQMSPGNGQTNSETDTVSSGSAVGRSDGRADDKNSANGSAVPVDKGAKPKKKRKEYVPEVTAVIGRDSPSSIKMSDQTEIEQRKQKKLNKKKAKARLKAGEEKRTLITINPNNLTYYHGAPVVMSNTQAQANYRGASNYGNVMRKDRMAQQQTQIQQNLVSIQYLYNIDTRVKGETKIPNITAVQSKHISQVIVTDSNNNKIKIFDKDGQLKDQIETVRPTSVAVMKTDYVWCSESTVHIMASDRSFTTTLKFQNTGIIPHPVAWHKGNDVIIGNGNQIRRYKIDKENKNMKKTEVITPTDIYGNQLLNIFNIRSHKDGRIVSVDWNLKAVVISGADGKCTGN